MGISTCVLHTYIHFLWFVIMLSRRGESRDGNSFANAIISYCRWPHTFCQFSAVEKIERFPRFVIKYNESVSVFYQFREGHGTRSGRFGAVQWWYPLTGRWFLVKPGPDGIPRSPIGPPTRAFTNIDANHTYTYADVFQ